MSSELVLLLSELEILVSSPVSLALVSSPVSLVVSHTGVGFLIAMLISCRSESSNISLVVLAM